MVTLPETPATRGMFDAAFVARIKRGEVTTGRYTAACY